MADSTSEVIGGVAVQITGDYSSLQADFAAAASQAADSGQSIADAFNQGAAAAGQDVATLSDSLGTLDSSSETAGEAATELGASMEAAGAQTQSLAEILDSAGGAAESLAPPMEEASESVKETGEAAQESEGHVRNLLSTFLEFEGIRLGAEEMRDFVEEAIASYGASEDLKISLAALSGDSEQAGEAFEQLKATALEMAVPFEDLETTMQRMAPALLSNGVPLQQISSAMEAIAATARVTGEPVEQVGQSVERMALSSQLGARQLATLGISLQQLSEQLGTTAEDLQGKDSIWKSLDPGDKLNALVGALQHYEDAARQMATDTKGQIQNLKTEWNLDLEDIGASLAPVTVQVLSFAEKIGGVVKPIIEAWGGLPSVVKLLELAFPPLAATVTTATTATHYLNEGVDALKEPMQNVGASAMAFNVAMEQGVDPQKQATAAATAAAPAHAAAAAAVKTHAQALTQLADAYTKADSVSANFIGPLETEETALQNDTEEVYKWAAAHQLAVQPLLQNVTALNQLDDAALGVPKALEAIIPPMYDLSQVGKTTTQDIIGLITALPKITSAIPPVVSDTNAWTQTLDQLGKKVNQVFSRDFSTALTDILFQTKNLGAAFEKVGEDIVKTILDVLIKQGLKALGESIEQVAGPGLSALLGSFTKTATTAAAVTKTQSVGEIMSDAAVAYAATYASISAIPIVGPAMAPAAAAASYSAVAGEAALASFDTGGWVPEDMLAMVHKGEYVVPADQASSGSGGIGGAAGSSNSGFIFINYGTLQAPDLNTLMNNMIKGARRIGAKI